MPMPVHRLDGVEDEAHERVAKLEGDTLDGRQRFHVLRDGDDDPAPLGVVAPARRRQVERFLDDGGQTDGAEGDLRLPRHEILESPHRRRGLERHFADDHEPSMSGRILRRIAEEELGVGQDGRERVVEVVRETAHGLPERAEIVAVVEPPAALDHAAGEVAGPAPEGQDRAIELDLGARHLARDVLYLFVVREEQGILGRHRLGASTDPLPQLFPDPSHAEVSLETYRLTSWATRSRCHVASPKVNSDPLARLK
jgi:hypothetical protein